MKSLIRKKVKYNLIAFLSLILFLGHAQNSKFLDSLLKNISPQFSKVISNPEKYKLQIIYTQINRDSNNIPSFQTFTFNESSNYIYPASTVKLPVTIAALVKLKELNAKGVNLNSAIITDSAFYCQKKTSIDTSSESKYPTLATYLKKMWLVSDNASNARVYEFIGCDYLHKQLEANGFDNVRIVNRLDGQCPGDTAKITPSVCFLGTNNDTLYKQPLTYSVYNKPHPVSNSMIGKTYRDGRGKKQTGPKDFSKHNFLSLNDCHEMMRRLVFNPYINKTEQLNLNDSDRLFVLKQAGMYPRESIYPSYDKKVFYDSYKKYFIYGSSVATIKSDSVRVFNIVGRAYGFLIDCAYVVDFKNKLEFMLSSCVYVNEKEDVGSGKYEYDKLGLPFLKDLSWLVYGYEKKRQKKYLPDLKDFNFFDYK